MSVWLLRLFAVLRLALTSFVLVVSGIGLAVFLIFYGIRAGLVQKKIRIYRLMEFDVTDKEAVRNGWFYIVMGFILTAIFIRVVTIHDQWFVHLFQPSGK
ncbi:MAG: hypothetical protein ACYDBV_13340 [Nitrospiria bacterium]